MLRDMSYKAPDKNGLKKQEMAGLLLIVTFKSVL